jgi:hypothetical protein
MRTSEPIKSHLYAAFRKVLRPLVRILLKAGVRYDEFSELVRGVYVESALIDGIAGVENPSRPRISIATGVPAFEVNRFIDDPDALPKAQTTLARAMIELLQLWHTEPEFSGPYGIPMELTFDEPGGRSFKDLAALIGTPASPGILLEQLIESGAVSQTAENTFRATSRYYMLQRELSPQQLEYLGTAFSRFANTLQFNSDSNNSRKLLERFVISDRGLSLEVLQKFQDYSKIKANEFLVDLDNWLAPYTKVGEPNEATEKYDTGVNVFNFVEPRNK